MSYRAYVERDVMRDVTRLLLFKDAGDRTDVLLEDGSWMTVPEGVRPNIEMGFPIPANALPAIMQALAEHLGNALPSQAEVSVLREWLDVERKRVDSFLPPGVAS